MTRDERIALYMQTNNVSEDVATYVIDLEDKQVAQATANITLTTNNNTQTTRYATQTDIIEHCVEDVLDNYIKTLGQLPDNRRQIEFDILELVNKTIEIENSSIANPKLKIKYLDKLTPHIVQKIVGRTGLIANIMMADGSMVEGVYHNRGELRGLWRYDVSGAGAESQIVMKLIYDIAPYFKESEVNDTKKHLFAYAPVRQETTDNCYVALRNGVFNVEDKTFTLWKDVDKSLTFMKKASVDYIPNVPKVYIDEHTKKIVDVSGMDAIQLQKALDDGDIWEYNHWLLDFACNNEDKFTTLWEINAYTVMPFVFTDRRMIFFIDGCGGKGNNGKDTFWVPLKDITGCSPTYRNVVGLQFTDWSHDFKIAQLPNATLSLASENAVGVYVDDITNLKRAVTEEEIVINGKYKTPFSYTPTGKVLAFLLNSYIGFRDKTDSFFRRQLSFECNKRYPVGQANKTYIKKDFMHRREVQEYIVSYVIDNLSDLRGFTDFAYLEDAKDTYREKTNPVLRFMNEITSECVWDFLTYEFLYDLYKNWYQEKHGNLVGLKKDDEFRNDVDEWCNHHTDWVAHFETNKNGTVKRAYVRKKASFGLSKPEPLVIEYQLEKWQNRRAWGTYDNNKIAMVPDNMFKDKISGIERVSKN